MKVIFLKRKKYFYGEQGIPGQLKVMFLMAMVL